MTFHKSRPASAFHGPIIHQRSVTGGVRRARLVEGHGRLATFVMPMDSRIGHADAQMNEVEKHLGMIERSTLPAATPKDSS